MTVPRGRPERNTISKSSANKRYERDRPLLGRIVERKCNNGMFRHCARCGESAAVISPGCGSAPVRTALPGLQRWIVLGWLRPRAVVQGRTAERGRPQRAATASAAEQARTSRGAGRPVRVLPGG